MTFTADLITFVKAISGMSAITTRAYWLTAPESAALPYVTLQQVSGAVGVAHDGDDGLRMGLVQIDCFAADFATALSMGELIEAALAGYKGTMTSTVVDAVFPQGRTDLIEDTSPPTYRTRQDFEIHYQN